MKDVVIIGGGASGLAAAISAARLGATVTILEKNNKCGKKLLITGNGRCNFWNEDQDIVHYHSYNKDLLAEFLDNDNFVLKFFDSLGIVYNNKGGCYYPFSNQALTVQNILVTECQRLGVEIIYNFDVFKVEKKDCFFINDKIKAKKVIVASGSKAASKTGSDGFGYDIALGFGHKITKVLPSLVQLKGDEDFFKKWSGIRVLSEVKLYENGKFIKKEFGELQLTDYGLSGICIFNLSGIVSSGLDKNFKEVVGINFMPWTNDALGELKKLNKESYHKNISELLEGFLNYKLVDIILKKAGIRRDIYLSNLSKDEMERLLRSLTDFKIDIFSTNSFEKAQVCQGGVSLKEINSKTMESLKVRNLFFIGEVVDIDGDCGGYNLGWAWISGIKAGRSVI
ncbi:MAG: aminoacetone oxidase family FAD-binding enzyme [Bacilli bacterium]|nr:aminoacetone oxidase family FAD-binding enzyme [Bacilli bacterium]